MLNRYLVLLACLTTLFAHPADLRADTSIPPDSLESLRDIFTGVRDNLWGLNDHFWHRGEYERCIAMMRLITRIDPTDIQAYDDGAWLMQNQLRDDEAEAFLLEGLRWNADVYDLYDTLGYFYYTHERFDESIAYLQIATAYDSPVLVWHKLAHSCEHGGHVLDSLNIWLALQPIEPDSPVPGIQIRRMLAGELPPDVPGFLSRAREERKAKQDQSSATN